MADTKVILRTSTLFYKGDGFKVGIGLGVTPLLNFVKKNSYFFDKFAIELVAL